ncbi:HlyD family secretion protein [Effusibacillus dendaii]|uniref:Secretion protein HlyD n=1 Tax=Effusibacillus dendaii TaxID=2743772 RepID=A0A7I8DGW0_9BACL|nr:efflux RND transporter periplasmic adaptor subunit [Effusibacillus dendaii]BCJ87810.1 secretion protein HlyD [Effusibacillus dendaii]
MKLNRKQVLILILALMVIVGGGIGGYFWYQSTHYVSTDDARISGDIYRVMPKVAGKLNTLNIDVGDYVAQNQIVGQQDTVGLPNTMLDQATLRSPISGMVIQKMAEPGEVVAPGQAIAMVVDKQKLYVQANIEETYINKLSVGQFVEFTVDTFPGKHFTGKVKEIGEATNSTFSLLPPVNTSGNFTKVTQRVPIKISIDDQQNVNLSPGMSAVIKIHLKSN